MRAAFVRLRSLQQEVAGAQQDALAAAMRP